MSIQMRFKKKDKNWQFKKKLNNDKKIIFG